LKTITGYLAILLGGVGVILTLAITGGVWWAAHQLADRVQQVTEQADQSLTQVEEGLGRMQRELESTSEAVEAVRTAAARERPNATGSKADVERMRNTLLPLLERTDALREVLPAVASVIDNVAGLVEQTGQVKSRSDALRSVAGNVRDATTALESVRREAVALREKEAPTATDLANLAQRARRPVDLLARGLSDTKQQSESLRAELPKLRRLVDDWKITGPAILTGILFWIGLGQLAIVAWGRRRLAARTATA
jgi:chromosome segregation ATPase